MQLKPGMGAFKIKVMKIKLGKYQILRGNLGCGFLTLSWCSCLLQMCLKMFSIKTLRVTEISIHSPSFSDGGLSVHVVLWGGEVWFPVIS